MGISVVVEPPEASSTTDTERTFYVSGPHPIVTGIEKTLQALGIKDTHIKKDFFPGLV